MRSSINAAPQWRQILGASGKLELRPYYFQRAKRNGVELLALTDHDEVDGLARARAAAIRRRMKKARSICSPRRESASRGPVCRPMIAGLLWLALP